MGHSVRSLWRVQRVRCLPTRLLHILRFCQHVRCRVVCVVLLILGGSGCSFVIRADELQTLAEVQYPSLGEISGIAHSSSYPDVYWVHNDTGDSARLFPIHLDGSVVLPTALVDAPSVSTVSARADASPGIAVTNARNVDWEEIALQDGMLYIADVGNNANARQDLGVYMVPEPNPLNATTATALSFLPIRYPDQIAFPGETWHFDCESMFIDAGNLYFLTKHRRSGSLLGLTGGTKLYRLNTRFTDQPNVLQLIASSDALVLPTAAALSPDGNQLAVLTYQRLWLFARPTDGGDNWLASTARVFDLPLLRSGQAEAVTWQDADSLIIGSENRKLFRLPVSALHPAP